MLRVLTAVAFLPAALAFLPACTPAARLAAPPAQSPTVLYVKEPSTAAARFPDLEKAHAGRLAPPFGRSSGVRRVSESSEPVPTIVAAVGRD